MDIEEVAAKTPEKVLSFTIDPASGISGFHGRKVAFALGLEGRQVKQCVDLLNRLYHLFTEKDAEMVEINPLIVTTGGDLLCLDAKMSFDSNALFRQKDILALRDETEEDPKELAASEVRPQLHRAGRRDRLHGQRRRPRHGHHGHHQALRCASPPTSSTSAVAPPARR